MAKKKVVPSVATKATKRTKLSLKLSPVEAAADCVKSMNKRTVDSVLVFGYDEFTTAFLEEAMRKGKFRILYSELDDNKATAMTRILMRFNYAGLRCRYVNKLVAMKEPWSEILILGSTENSLELATLGFNFPEILVLEEF